MNRFGFLAGWVLLILQSLFVACLFHVGWRMRDWGDRPQQAAGELLGLALYAFGWLFLAHWVIAWGNVLGLLPVMGQPMTFLSAGNSHLLAFAFPGVLLGLVGAWILRPLD